MFINISNHPSVSWPDSEKREAERYGQVIDIPFPEIRIEYSSEQIDALVEETMKKLQAVAGGIPKGRRIVVMAEGEFVFTYRLVSKIKQTEMIPVAAITRRVSREKVDATGAVIKTSQFIFEGFRRY
ncbi:MAG: hypothetical protein ACI4ET_06870 [Bilifractor sp.]